jgi:ribose 5-phosphate isomerase B
LSPDIDESALQDLVERVVLNALGKSSPSTSPLQSGRKLIAIGSDHRGIELKQELMALLGELGYACEDCSADLPEPADYPDIAEAVATRVASGKAWRGIVIDGAGIGSCIAANKVPGVRAALCYNQTSASNAREHNDSNVLSLGSGLLGIALARSITRTWLETSFAGGRHARRVDKIRDLEKRYGAH